MLFALEVSQEWCSVESPGGPEASLVPAIQSLHPESQMPHDSEIWADVREERSKSLQLSGMMML